MEEIGAVDHLRTVQITRPHHLCDVQIATRQICRAMDFNEGAVFDAVIGVSELAHRLLLSKPLNGEVKLCAVRMRDGYALEAKVISTDEEESTPPATNCATFFPGKHARA